jgi:hypothetical protein
VSRIKVKSVSIVILMFVSCIEGRATNRIIQQDIHTLKDLGYTGKGVKVGVLDYFQGTNSHGSVVLPFIREVAPQAEVYWEDVSDFKKDVLAKHTTVKQMFTSLKVKAERYITVPALKASSVNVSQVKSLVSQNYSPSCYPHLFENVTFSKGEEVTTSLAIADVDVYKFAKNGKEYYVPFSSLTNHPFIGRVSGKNAININDAEENIVAALRRLRSKGATIITASIPFVSGRLFEAELKKLANDGGVFVSSAGNDPLTFAEKEIGLSKVNMFNLSRSVALWHSLQWRELLKEDEIKKSCLIVGALRNEQQIASYSALSGEFKNRFISAVVDEQLGSPTGTSFSAPQIAGIEALLQEAYPTCQPKTLAKAILKSGAPVQFDPQGELTGRGRVDPLAAFKKAYEICGMPPQGLKGQKFLLPADFKVEGYLSLNPDLHKVAVSMTPAQKEEFGVQHYLQHGVKEKRLYKGSGLPEDFNADAYIYAHPDLVAHTKAMTPTQRRSFAYEHYLAHGKEEGRSHQPSGILQTFNPEAYLSFHADVKVATQGMTSEDARSFAYWHYVHHGAQEGRRHAPDALPQGFNPQRYLELNSDVKDHTKSMSSVEASSFATWHYINHGKIEKRRY